MRANLILTTILAFLLSIAYYSEEVVKKEVEHKRILANRLIPQEFPIAELRTKNFHIVKLDGRWSSPVTDWSLDQSIITSLLDVFSKIYISSLIETTKKKEFIGEESSSFEVKINGKWQKYILGRVSKASGAFYVQREGEEKIYICYDDSFLDEIHKNQVDLDFKKYLRLKGLLDITINPLLNQDILGVLGMKSLKRVRIDNKRNRWFELDFIKSTTEPKIYPEFKYLNLAKRFKQQFKSIKIKKVISNGKYVLTNLRSTIEIEDHESKKSMLKLFIGLNGKFGYFLKLDGHAGLLELDLSKKNIFFTSVQDFWNRKINYNLKFSEQKNIHFKLGKSAKKFYSFYIDDIEKFEIKTKNKQVNFISKVHMNFLFNVVLNLIDFKQAKYVERLTKTNKETFDLHLKVFRKSLGIKLGKHLITVFDFESKIAYYFDYNTQQIKPGFFDKIFTVVNK
jgi:hypothetical protein